MNGSLSRSYTACFLSLNPNVLTGLSAAIEAQLSRIVPVKIETIGSLNDVASRPWDLLIVDALILTDHELPKWIDKLHEKMKGTSTVWTPGLILSQCSMSASLTVLEQVIAFNWYFDIVSPDHLESIPIRIANLIRIHDHLKELNQYQGLLDDLQRRVETLETHTANVAPDRTSHE